ncbi:PTS fructose-like transporter subunit IIB [Clostridium sp. DL1XJH146]
MKILGITACPTGVAHTYMAAEALEKACKARGYEVKVETQGSIGIENEITKEDIVGADVVILSKDIAIKGKDRFNGIPVVNVKITDIIKNTNPLLDKVIAHINKLK